MDNEIQLNETQQGIFDNFRANNQNLISTNQLETANPLTLPTSGQTAIPDSLSQFTQASPGTQQRQEQLQQGQETNAGTLNEIFSGLTTLGTRGATQSKLEDQAGIGTLSTELTDIENQLRTKDLEFRRQREALQKEAGLTTAQRQARLADVARGQASELADLEVIRQARSNSLTNAQSLIDKKVQLHFADVQAKVDALKFVYNENKETLTKEEDRLLNETIRKEERAFGIAKDKYQAFETQKAEIVKNASSYGASNSDLMSIMSAKTESDLMKLGNISKYMVSPAERLDLKLKQAQLNKLTATDTGEAPTIKSINGIDMQWDGSKWVTPNGGTPPRDVTQILELEDKINKIDGLIDHKGLSQSVGTTGLFGRGGTLAPGRKQDFIADVQQLVSQDTLNTLINLKAKGGTLGALSNEERIMLQNAASKIGFWAKPDKNGKVIGYEAPEQEFKDELMKIKMVTERAYDKATGGTESYLDTLDLILQETVNPYTQAGYILD